MLWALMCLENAYFWLGAIGLIHVHRLDSRINSTGLYIRWSSTEELSVLSSYWKEWIS